MIQKPVAQWFFRGENRMPRFCRLGRCRRARDTPLSRIRKGISQKPSDDCKGLSRGPPSEVLRGGGGCIGAQGRRRSSFVTGVFDKSVPFGKYCGQQPVWCSFDRVLPGRLCGSQKRSQPVSICGRLSVVPSQLPVSRQDLRSLAGKACRSLQRSHRANRLWHHVRIKLGAV